MEPPKKLFNRNYLLQWQGQSISRLGSQGFSIAMLFWIKHATGSAALMGLLSMLSSLPGVLLGPIGGALADRYSRRKIIIFSDMLRGIAVLSLAALLYLVPDSTHISLVWLFIVAVFIAIVSTFFGPAIQATIPDLVPEDKVTSANSMGQLSIQLSVFIGQGLGGTLFRILGAPILFIIDGVTYLFASFSESFVVIPQKIPEKSSHWKAQFAEFRKDILEGLHYVWNRSGLRELVFVSAVLSFFTAPVIILLPFYVEDILKVEIDWYGFLLAAYGVGTFIGYVFAGALNFAATTRGKLMMAFIIAEAMGYGLLGLVTTPFMAMILALAGGFAGGYVTVNITTILQVSTPGEIRGRVFGLLLAISGSLAPIAMGMAGVVADLLNQNIPLIYVSCGLIMATLSIVVSMNRDFRNILAYKQEVPAAQAVPEPAIPLN